MGPIGPGPGPGLSLEDWLEGPEALDLNDDGEIDEEDFQIFVDEMGPIGPGPGPGLSLEDWLEGPEAMDLNDDGVVDEEDFQIFVDEMGPIGPGPGPGLSLEDWLEGPEAMDLNDDGVVDEEDFQIFVDEMGPIGPGPDPLGELIDELFAAFDEDPEQRIRVEDRRDELEPMEFNFLKRIAGSDGLLTLDDLERALGGPGEPGGKIGAFEGILEGLDLEAGLIFIDGEEFKPAEGIVVQDGEGRGIDVLKLRELAGSFPLVFVELNPDDEVMRLEVLTFFDDIGGPGGAEEFFGPVSLIDDGKIVLSGPRFRVTGNTRATDKDNNPLALSALATGQLISITLGAPDFDSGSFDPTAVRIQVVDPRRPPPPRADIITGNLVSFAGPQSDDPHVELDGPRAGVNAETAFKDAEGNPATAADVQKNDFVRVEIRQPGFGEANPVAVVVEILEGDIGPLPGEDEGGRPDEEIRMEGFVREVGSDFLLLEGERMKLARQVLVLGVDGATIGLESLLGGDLLEIDTRPEGPGFVVTRVKVVDPAAQIFERPGVIVGGFEGIVEGELVLTGPFLKVPTDADIDGLGGLGIQLSDIQQGDFVRLSASPPRFERGETLPVAFRIRVTEPPFDPGDEVIPAGERRVVGSFPVDGDVEVSRYTQVEVLFSGNVNNLIFDPEFEFTLFPEPVDFGGLEISRDGRTLSAEVELEEDQSYQLVVISRQTGLFSIRFSTGASISDASIVGVIELPPELPSSAQVLPGESFAVLVEELLDVALLDDFANFEEKVVAGTPLEGPGFTFENVDTGSYYLVAFVAVNMGRGEFIEFDAFFDADGDGEPDLVEVGEGAKVEVGLTLVLPEPLEVVSLTPEERTVGVDLETDLVIEFNRPAFLFEEDILIFPEPLSIGGLEENEDGTVFTLSLELEEDTIYRVVVDDAEDEDGGGLIEPAASIFTTADEFVELSRVSGRLVLPELPPARVFDGPILIGLVDAEVVDLAGFSFNSFDEEDVVASTIAFTPEFAIEDVPEGEYVAVAFAVVDVPKGFRPPDPQERPLGDFDIQGGRYSNQVLEVFDTIELFGFSAEAGGPVPALISSGDDAVEIFLRGEGKTRKEILSVDGLQAGDLVFDLKPGTEPPVVEAGEVEVRVRFNKGLRVDRNFVSIEAGLNGRSLRRFQVEDEGKTIVFPVTLEEEQFYRFSVFHAEAKDGSILDRPLDISFSTGGETIAFGSIAGSVTLATLSEEGEALTGDDADQVDAAKVFLFEEDEDEELALVSVAELAKDGSFSLGDILPGSYQVFAELETASGQEINAIYDTDDDGVADLVTVGDGASLTGIDIAASVVVATEKDETTGVTTKSKPSGGNAEALLTIDMDGTAGDQSLTTLTNVNVGDEVSIDVHVSGATDVSGFAAKLTYDADILDFVEATDVVSGVTNFLRMGNGTALFLYPLLREPELEYGGAILGATETTAPDGAGFLARFKFQVKSEFEGAQVTLNEVKLKSTKGEDVITSSLSAKLAPPVFTEQKKGVVSFDFNTATGDQEEFHKGFVTAGSQVEVDVYLNLDKIGSDFTDLSNYSVTVEFDTKQLSYISYSQSSSTESNLLGSKGGTVLPLPAIVSDNSVTFGNAILGPTADTAPDSSGLIGRLTFSTTSDFSETDLLLTKYAYKSVSGSQQEVSSIIIARMSTGEITKVAAGGSGDGGEGGVADVAGADFDGDGSIGFGDFFRFADSFGKTAEGDAAMFDLDKSGAVDFGDFFVFADLFGKSVGKRVVDDTLPVVEGLVLTPQSDSDELVLSLRSDLSVRGYGAVVEYDPSAFELVSVSDASSVLRQGGESLLLQEEQMPGRVLLLGSATGGASAVDGLLAELRFAPVRPEAEGLFRLEDAVVRAESGDVAQVQDLAPVRGRWVPQVFALHANYPNPFNPSTAIRYQLAEMSQVRLEVFDVLGQKVRTLVADVQPAGVHRLVWDSRNDMGHLVGAGVYLYRLRAGEFTQVRKLLLLK